MGNEVREQYRTVENFNLRGNLHSFNTNKIDWNNWCFNQMQFPGRARILELGCGSGEFFYQELRRLKVIFRDFMNNE